MMTLTDREHSDLSAFVKVKYGIDLSTRKSFVEMRLQRMKEAEPYDNFTDFFCHICADPTGAAVADFVSNLTVNYTLFYREALHFEFLRETVLPELVLKQQEEKDLRIWSAGCATGEEPYTIAMVVSDYMGYMKPKWDCRILATDISCVALRKATEAVYPENSIEGLNPAWIRRYFVKECVPKGFVSLSDEIKSEVIFKKHNLVADMFFFKKRFHCIFCRNVMIYFDEATKYRVLRRLYDALEEGGYLFIGMSETIEKGATPFVYVRPSVYRKEGEGR